ncbi:MAG TPA: lysozyme inhibitor LprI family protein [Burkholderiales bacterium]|nr:lysozyme inhibitor LprI family protein [Burkholderiales bacterium]
MRNVLLSCLIAFAAPAGYAVVDCGRATTIPDRLVCSNDRLAEADDRMAAAFHQALRRGVDHDLLMRTQREWKTRVRDVCTDVAYLLKAYEERAAELDNL